MNNRMTGKSSDPFDEFEFKPLTEGLGFHNKAISLKDEVAASGLASATIEPEIPEFKDLIEEAEQNEKTFQSSAALSDLPDSPLESEYVKSFTDDLDEIRSTPQTEIKKPLPRNEEESTYSALQEVETKLDLDFNEAEVKTPSLDKEILQVEEKFEYTKVPTAIFASVFDGVVAFTLSILFMVAMMSVIQVDLLGLLLNAETQLMTQLSFVGMYLAILQLYMVIARSVAKCTLGEWAFDIHLAQKDGETTAIFPLLVIWRSFLIIATGFVVLPFLSLITRRDVASYLTGTQLFQLK